MNIETNIARIFEESAIALSDDVIAEAHSLLDHREYGVAFELICNQLYETDANISHNLYVQMAIAGKQMGLPPTTWQFLAELVS